MALKIAAIEPVEFGDRKCFPKLNADKRLRLAQIKQDTEQARAKANQVIASCFPDDEDFVLDFLENQISENDRQILTLYLRGGQTALDAYNKAYDEMMQDAISNAKEAQK